jgi:hypothetical protein
MIFKMVMKLCFPYSSSLTSLRRLRVPMLEPKLQVLMLKWPMLGGLDAAVGDNVADPVTQAAGTRVERVRDHGVTCGYVRIAIKIIITVL